MFSQVSVHGKLWQLGAVPEKLVVLSGPLLDVCMAPCWSDLLFLRVLHLNVAEGGGPRPTSASFRKVEAQTLPRDILPSCLVFARGFGCVLNWGPPFYGGVPFGFRKLFNMCPQKKKPHPQSCCLSPWGTQKENLKQQFWRLSRGDV